MGNLFVCEDWHCSSSGWMVKFSEALCGVFCLHILHFIEKSLQIHLGSKYCNFRSKNQIFLIWAIFKNACSLKEFPPCFLLDFLPSQQPKHVVSYKSLRKMYRRCRSEKRGRSPGAQWGLKLPPRKEIPRECLCSNYSALPCGMKVALGNGLMNECGCVLIKLYL